MVDFMQGLVKSAQGPVVQKYESPKATEEDPNFFINYVKPAKYDHNHAWKHYTKEVEKHWQKTKKQ
jgi:hypothetical protein